MKILITGGAGFIGSSLVNYINRFTNDHVLNLDKLTYAGNIQSLSNIHDPSRYQFVQADICDAKYLTEIIHDYHPDVVIHLAAESHVDRSIDSPSSFIVAVR